MKNTRFFAVIIASFFLILGCKSIHTTYTFKSSEVLNPKPFNKVLIVGLTTNTTARNFFEKKLASKFESNKIQAIRSVDYFTQRKDVFISQEDIDDAEEDLINQGFDTILISKVVGTDEQKTLLQTILKLNKAYSGFSDNEIHQKPSFDEEFDKNQVLYITETAMYCICPKKEKSLIWKTQIKLKKHKRIKYDINRFVNHLFRQMYTDLALSNVKHTKP